MPLVMELKCIFKKVVLLKPVSSKSLHLEDWIMLKSNVFPLKEYLRALVHILRL